MHSLYFTDTKDIDISRALSEGSRGVHREAGWIPHDQIFVLSYEMDVTVRNEAVPANQPRRYSLLERANRVEA